MTVSISTKTKELTRGRSETSGGALVGGMSKRRTKSLKALERKKSDTMQVRKPEVSKPLSSRITESVNTLYQKGYVGNFLNTLNGANVEALIKEIDLLNQGIDLYERTLQEYPKDHKKIIKKKLAKLRLLRALKEKELMDLGVSATNTKNQLQILSLGNQSAKFVSVSAGGFAQKISPLCNLGQSLVALPVQIQNLKADRERLQLLDKVKQYYVNDPELVSITEYLENKKFLYTDGANLLFQIPDMIFNKLGVCIGGLVGVLGLTSIPVVYQGLVMFSRLPMYLIAKVSFVLNLAVNAYKFIYFKQQANRVVDLKKQVGEILEKTKIEEEHKAYKYIQEVTAEAKILGQKLSDEQVKERVLQKINLELMSKSGELIAYRLLERLQKEGAGGKTASYLMHIGFHPSGADSTKKYDYIRDIMKLDLSDDESLELAVKTLTKYLGL